MAQLFNRLCKLTVGDSGNSQALELSGLRITFVIEKSSVGYPNTATIRVYNLSNSTRQLITERYDRVILEAGYEGDSGVIFQGNIFNVFHRREQPEYISEIYASDGGFNYRESYTNRSYGNGVRVSQIVEDLRQDLNLDIGQINADLTEQKINGYNITGDSSSAMSELGVSHGFRWSIQTGKLYVIGNDRKIDFKPAFEITAESGMIGSPVLTERGIDVKTLLNWQLIPEEEIRIVSLSQPVNFKYLNLWNRSSFYPETQGAGSYIARKLVHTGDTRGNDWYTDIEGYFLGDRA